MARSLLPQVEKVGNMLDKLDDCDDITEKEFELLQTLCESGKHAVAVNLAKKFVLQYPRSSTLHNFLGVIYSNLGVYSEAIAQLKKSIDISPNFSHSHNNLGVTYLQISENKKAQSCFEKAIELDADVAHFHYNHSKPLYLESEYKAAVKSLKRAITLRDNYVDAMNDLGNCLVAMGDIIDGIAIYEEVLKLDPKYFEVVGNIGLAYAKLGNPNEAINYYLRALEISPECSTTKANLVELLKVSNFDHEIIHPILTLERKIRGKTKNLSATLSNSDLCRAVDESLEIVDRSNANIDYNASQIFRRNSIDLNCNRHLKLFETKSIVPEFCFGCFKVQIEVLNFLDLIRLAKLFYEIEFDVDLTRKCMIETRPGVGGFYKGFVYCSSLGQAKKVKRKLDLVTKNESWTNKIKRGCTEYTAEFPGFDVVDDQQSMMKYPQGWREKEIAFDEIYSMPPQKTKIATQPGFCLSDILIIERWIDYAKGIGDETVSAFDKRPIKYTDTYNLASQRADKYALQKTGNM